MSAQSPLQGIDLGVAAAVEVGHHPFLAGGEVGAARPSLQQHSSLRASGSNISLVCSMCMYGSCQSKAAASSSNWLLRGSMQRATPQDALCRQGRYT